MKRSAKGFSLIELLIVVAIILIIAAIAIPNLMRSRIAANQASAVESLRSLNTAELTYSSTYNQGFSSNLAQLASPASGQLASSTAAGLIDSVLANGAKSGYSFSYSAATAVNNFTPAYAINASPLTLGTSGIIYYFTDQSNVIRQNATQVASSADSPLAG